MITRGTIALVGDTGSGKTTQIGALASKLYKKTGRRTVLFSSERGGHDSIEHLIELGIIKLVEYDPDSEMDFMVWAQHVVRGEEFLDGKWVAIDRAPYGLWAFDSGSSMADEYMNKLAVDQANGKIIGGKSSFSVTLGDGVKVASNTETHYGLAQTDLRQKIWTSQRLMGSRDGTHALVLWTFALDRDEKADRKEVVGPRLAGHALTTQIPRWFRYTFRLEQLPVEDGRPEHVLYLTTHTHSGLAGYGNARVALEVADELDVTLKPASLPRALEMLDEFRNKARDIAAADLGLA